MPTAKRSAQRRVRTKPVRVRTKARAPQQRRRTATPVAIELALAELAHDIRTPLAGILALGELLAASELGERERSWATAIRGTAEHLALLTSLIVDAVRADAKGLVLRREPIDLPRLTETLATALVARTETKGLHADIAIGGLPQRVIGDGLRLRAALENLLDNAVKFSERGNVRFAAQAQPA